MITFLAAIAGLTAGSVPPPPAKIPTVAEKAAPKGMVSIDSPSSIVAALQAEGYRAKLITGDGSPYIESSTSGSTFYIYLENCKNGKNCEDAMLRSSYDLEGRKVALDKLNEFNRDKRWTKAYLDKDSNPVIEFDLLFIDRVMTEKEFTTALEIWNELLPQFHKAIDW